MTPEELLQPRVIVCGAPDAKDGDSPYPQSPFKVGDILIKENESKYASTVSFAKCKTWTINRFPHIFRRLEWWEKRELSDMPKYVMAKDGIVWKVDLWRESHMGILGETNDTKIMDGVFMAQWTTPATESDYNEFINSKK